MPTDNKIDPELKARHDAVKELPPEYDRWKFTEIEDEFTPISRIYIDMEMLKDFKLGALLTLIDSEAKYDYVRSQIPYYNHRLDDDTLKYFPKLSIDPELFNQRLIDPKYQVAISVVAPNTTFFYELGDILFNIINHNHRTGNDTLSIKIDFVTQTIPALADRIKHALKDRIRKYTNIRDVAFYQSKDYEFVSIDYLKTLDIMYLYSYNKLMNEQHPCANAIKFPDMCFSHTSIFARPVADKVYEDPEQLLTELEYTRKVVGIFCRDFNYVSPHIPEAIKLDAEKR